MVFIIARIAPNNTRNIPQFESSFSDDRRYIIPPNGRNASKTNTIILVLRVCCFFMIWIDLIYFIIAKKHLKVK